MGHNPKIPPGARPETLHDAQLMGEPVNLYCLNCARPRRYSAWKLYQQKGDLAFGALQGGFWCRGCKTSTVIVVLPCDMASPRDWVSRFSTSRVLR